MAFSSSQARSQSSTHTNPPLPTQPGQATVASTGWDSGRREGPVLPPFASHRSDLLVSVPEFPSFLPLPGLSFLSMTSSPLFQLPIPLSPHGGFALPSSARRGTGACTQVQHVSFSSLCTFLHLLAWSPSEAPEAPQQHRPWIPRLRVGPRGSPPTLGGADQGCLPGIGSWIGGDLRHSDGDGCTLSSPQVA